MTKNITCCATISEDCVELLRFFVGGGTRNEVFEDYMEFLLKELSRKYPDKKLLIILDNLWAHKTCMIIRILGNYTKASLLFTPACTPQFSPIGTN